MKISNRLTKLREYWKEQGPHDIKTSKQLLKISMEVEEQERQLKILSVVGAELGKLKNQSTALELILNTARELTSSDAGTVYILVEEYHDDPFNPGDIKSKSLSFEVLQNETMNVDLRRAEGGKDILPPVPLEVEGVPNHQNVCSYCANTGSIINIPDVYHAEGFDFSGPKKYDQATGYLSKSMLVLPLRDHENELIGVLQLINRKAHNGKTIPFSKADQSIVHSMAYQAATSLTTQKLLAGQVRLFDSFVQVLAEGLGEKSPHTYGHINRVASLTSELAETIGSNNEGIYEDIQFNSTQMEEMRLSGWMHDIGKLTTPEHVVSKSTKLEMLMDGFDLVLERYNSKLKDLEIEALEEKIKALEEGALPSTIEEIEVNKVIRCQDLINDLNVLAKTNAGGEFLAEEDIELINKNACQETKLYFETTQEKTDIIQKTTSVSLAKEKLKIPLISKKEKEHFFIRRGTLSESERRIINEHADRSWRWLKALPFPRKMMKLPLIAAAHHETLNGKGYPNQLTARQLPIQSRIIAVVDVFEALTANDRPYKAPMSLSRALDILGSMVKNGHLDAEIVKIFLKSGLHNTYAKKFLNSAQIVPINVDEWLNKYYPKDFSNTLPEHTTN